MNLRPALVASALTAALAVGLAGAEAWAGTACQNDPTQCLCTLHPDDCSTAIQNSGGVVNDIFKDANGNTALQLPLFGKLFAQWAGCTPYEVNPGCAGTSNGNTMYNCPGNYACASVGGQAATAAPYLNTLDHTWWQPCRLGDPSLTTINGLTCPADWTCIADQQGGNYLPWTGLVFDLGGPSNKVAIFAENDHGPQPCESLEYTVFLTDNPMANQMTDIIIDPASSGVDPMKWNRAVLSKIFTWGWFNTRAPDPTDYGASCGDTTDYAVEDDSFVQVFSLPCGITFRYASIVAGNDGNDFPECTYHSSEAELDAVAGLTESGAGVCPDADGDHFVDCNCPGAPPVCDCNDGDPNVYPGAPEACDATVDYNCDGMIGTPCPMNSVCYMSVCDPICSGGENAFCPPGATCKNTAQGNLCVPDDCGCMPGQVCVDMKCVDACQGVVCPGSLVCQNGACIDPCANIMCPQGLSCVAGQCVSPCNCFAGDVGCSNGEVCDTGNTNLCVPPMCKGVSCPMGQTCDAMTGNCVDFCNPDVMCPQGQKCDDTSGGCVPLCTNVTCPANWACDPTSGKCVDMSCTGVTCFAPQVCVEGTCVTPDGGGAGGGTTAAGNGGAGGTGTGTMSTGSRSSSSGNGEGGAGGSGVGAKGKCSCRLPGGDGDGAPWSGALALVGLCALAARRRR